MTTRKSVIEQCTENCKIPVEFCNGYPSKVCQKRYDAYLERERRKEQRRKEREAERLANLSARGRPKKKDEQITGK